MQSHAQVRKFYLLLALMFLLFAGVSIWAQWYYAETAFWGGAGISLFAFVSLIFIVWEPRIIKWMEWFSEKAARLKDWVLVLLWLPIVIIVLARMPLEPNEDW